VDTKKATPEAEPMGEVTLTSKHQSQMPSGELTDDDIETLLRNGWRLMRDRSGLRMLPPKKAKARNVTPNAATKPRRDPAKAKAKRKAQRRARRAGR
jgi:hypothetical protein